MICVDANLAAKWVLAEELSDEALGLARACIQARQRIVEPPLLPIEVANIIRQRMLRDRISLAEAQELLRRFAAFPVTISAPITLYEDALTLADAYNLPAVYDAHYVALAQLLGCDLWTDDRRLLRALGGKLSFVKWIGDYQGEHSL